MQNLSPALEKSLDLLIRTGFSLIGCIPVESARRLSAWIGDLWFFWDRRHRKIALQNVGKAFGKTITESEHRQLVKQVFRNLVLMVFEIGQALKTKPEDFTRNIDIHGLNHMEEALARKKGIIAITAHTGNWELLSMLATVSPIPINIVYRPLDFGPLDRFFFDFRSRFGAKLIGKTESLKRLFACLRQNEVIALVMDQNVGRRKGVFVDFFGDIACTTKGPAYLAALTGAPVVPVFIRRSVSGFVVEIGKQISTLKTGDREKDIENNTLKYNRAIENFIRTYPDQWLWLHQRWKKRPKKNRHPHLI